MKGKFTTSIVVPSNAQIGYQTNGIVASGKNSGLAASAFFEVEPNISINPRTGTSGTLITVRVYVPAGLRSARVTSSVNRYQVSASAVSTGGSVVTLLLDVPKS